MVVPVDRHGGDLAAACRRWGLRPEEVLDFSASVNPLGPPAGVWEALRRALPAVTAYPDPRAGVLVEGLAGALGLPEECLLATNGAAEGIFLLLRALRPRRVLVTAPGFLEYERAARAVGATLAYLELRPENGWRLAAQDLAGALGAGDVFFLCNPHNPAGWALGAREAEEVRAACAAAGSFLAVDESFLPFLPPAEQASLAAAAARGGNLAVIGSLTKFYALPGLRVGYLVAAPALLDSLRAQRDPWSVNALAQAAGAAALEDSEYAARSRAYVAEERAFLAASLAALGCRVLPGTANFLMLAVRPARRAPALLEGLARQGILVRDLSGMRGLGEGFWRVAVRTRQENLRLLEKLEAAMKREEPA